MAVLISDGGATPHAANYSDLLDRLVTFATANGWTIVEDERADTAKRWIILSGEGLAGTDEIFVGLRLYKDDPTDVYGIRLQGFTGYVAGVAFDSQPGAIPHVSDSDLNSSPTVPLWNDEIPYWFVVNARRIVFVAKVSAVYEAGYLGYILPYALPGQYPYPLAVGGSAKGNLRFDATGAVHSHFVIPYEISGAKSNLRLRDASGVWLNLPITTPSATYSGSGTFPYMEASQDTFSGWSNLKKTPGSPDDVFVLTPVSLFSNDAAIQYRGNIFGVFDGIAHVGGLENAVENTVTIGADTYLVVRNVYRNTPGDFWALLLA